MLCGMEDVAAGIVPAYLSREQMRVFLAMCDEKGISRGQLAKEAVIGMLVNAGRLPEFELQRVQAKQQDLIKHPHGNRKGSYLDPEKNKSTRLVPWEEQEKVYRALAEEAGVEMIAYIKGVKDGTYLNPFSEESGQEQTVRGANNERREGTGRERVRRGAGDGAAGAASAHSGGEGSSGAEGEPGGRDGQRRRRPGARAARLARRRAGGDQ